MRVKQHSVLCAVINNKTVQRRQKLRAIGKKNQLTQALCSNLQPTSSFPPYCSNPSFIKDNKISLFTQVYTLSVPK